MGALHLLSSSNVDLYSYIAYPIDWCCLLWLLLIVVLLLANLATQSLTLLVSFQNNAMYQDSVQPDATSILI